MGPTYVSIPQLTPEQLSTPQMAVIESLRQNVSLLTGDMDSGNSAAITRNMITVSPVTSRNLESLSATGYGYAVQGVNLAAADDVRNLISDVAKLSSDVTELFNLFNQLIADMKGTSA